MGIVAADLLTFEDEDWWVKFDNTEPSRYLYYVLNLREGAADGPIVDTCQTSSTFQTMADCLL